LGFPARAKKGSSNDFVVSALISRLSVLSISLSLSLFDDDDDEQKQQVN